MCWAEASTARATGDPGRGWRRVAALVNAAREASKADCIDGVQDQAPAVERSASVKGFSINAAAGRNRRKKFTRPRYL